MNIKNSLGWIGRALSRIEIRSPIQLHSNPKHFDNSELKKIIKRDLIPMARDQTGIQSAVEHHRTMAMLPPLVYHADQSRRTQLWADHLAVIDYCYPGVSGRVAICGHPEIDESGNVPIPKASGAVEQLMSENVHRKMILGDWDCIGTGFAINQHTGNCYFVIDFFKIDEIEPMESNRVENQKDGED